MTLLPKNAHGVVTAPVEKMERKVLRWEKLVGNARNQITFQKCAKPEHLDLFKKCQVTKVLTQIQTATSVSQEL